MKDSNNKILKAIKDFKKGKMVIVVDDKTGKTKRFYNIW